MRYVVLACLLVGCTTFEDPTIVLDLRVLAMKAELTKESPRANQRLGPEQVIDLDPEHPPTPSEVLAQLEPTEVCALVADPGRSRRLRWSMTMCLLDDEGRCDLTRPYREVGNGLLEDPEEHPQNLCVTVIPDQRMFEVLFSAQQTDVLKGLGGIDFVIELQIGGELAERANDIYASKKLRVSPRIPADRQPNHNPYIQFLDGAKVGLDVAIPRIPCGAVTEDTQLPRILAGTTLTLFPVEPESAREDYMVPTLDGHIAQLTETITYQWLAGRGSFSDATTGGGHDILGNQSLLGTEWHPPNRNVLDHAILVSIWMIQRDERLGVSWFETCVEVVP